MGNRIYVLTMTAVFGLCVVGCASAAGPSGESSHSPVAIVGGWIAVDQGRGGVLATHIPDGRERLVVPGFDPATDNPWHVFAVCGPDVSGRVALIWRGWKSKSYRLTVRNLDGSDERLIAERPGDPLWQHAASRAAALSRDGKLAIISNLRPRQMPRALHQSGTIEVFDLANSGEPTRFEVDALDDTLAWLPDGRHLVFSQLCRREDAPVLARQADGYGSFYDNWPLVPVVHVLDVRTGNLQPLHIGRSPRVSRDGRIAVLMGEDGTAGWKPRYRLVKIADGHASNAPIPENVNPIAVVDDQTFVVLGLPPPGAQIKHTQSNSPLRGPKAMLNLYWFTANQPEWKPLVQDIDPRSSISVGWDK